MDADGRAESARPSASIFDPHRWAEWDWGSSILNLIRRILTPPRRILNAAGNGLHGAVALAHQNATAMLALIFLSAALMLIPAFLPEERRMQNTNLNANH